MSTSTPDPFDLSRDPFLRDVPEVEGFKVLEPVVLYAKIGQGGMGAVYRGKHLSLDIDVALKCLKPSLAMESAEFVTRFKREARVAAGINSENLIRVFDVNESHGLHYLIMEFVSGESARERVERKGALGVVESLIIVRGAAIGLAAAHAKGVVHRDIKPDNIMISTTGEVKVADLGLAKAAEGLDQLETRTGMVMGTPNYMPPEQYSDAKRVGPSGDVYALGVTLYYLLAGENAIASGALVQVMHRVCNEAFPDIRLKRSDLPEGLADLLKECTDKDPEQRPQRASEVAKRLMAFLSVGEDDFGGVLSDSDSLHDFDARSLLVSPPPQKTLARIKVKVKESSNPFLVPTKTGNRPNDPSSAGPKPKVRRSKPEKRAKAEPRSAKSNSWILFLALFVAALGLGGGFWWTNRSQPQDGGPFDRQANGVAKPAGKTERLPIEKAEVLAADVISPSLSLSGLPSETEDSEITVKGLALDENLSSVLVDGKRAVVAKDGRFSIVVKLRLGSNSIVVAAQDQAGNREEKTIRIEMIEVDRKDPVLSLMVVPRQTSESEWLIKGQVRDDNPVEIHINDRRTTVSMSGEFSRKVSLRLGTNSIAVRAQDQAGNRAEKSLSIERVDDPSPVLLLRQLNSDLAMDFKLIQSGSFQMGSPSSEKNRDDDEKRHLVTLTRDFYMAKTELTQGQWKGLMKSQPWSGKAYVKTGANIAASYLSWEDAQKYCAAMNQRYSHGSWKFRLPTEAEWEFCCRADNSSVFCFGESESGLGAYAWYDKNAWDVGQKYANAVAAKKANAWGLYDMHGNVWEWCQDWYGEYGGTSKNPEGPSSGSNRVFRGGSWFYEAQFCRSANRDRFTPDLRYNYLGFRLVLAPK
ncbi:MAG: SUMF1/EgtB/PvdO family nonheme iron enzyme [Planctomycetota bacterium]